MNMWSRLMRFFTPAPRQTPPPMENTQQEEALHISIMTAGKRHKAATDEVIRTSLDEVERARNVSVAINTIVGRLEPADDATLRLAQGALGLIQRTSKK